MCDTRQCDQPSRYTTPSGVYSYCDAHATCRRCGRLVTEYVRTYISAAAVIWACPCITLRDRELAHKVPTPILSTSDTVDRSNTVKPCQTVSVPALSQLPKGERIKETSLWS